MLFPSAEFKTFVNTQKEAPYWQNRYEAAWNELLPFLSEGLAFQVKGQQFRVRLLQPGDIDAVNQIVTAANTLPQLIGLEREGVQRLAAENLALVTEAETQNGWEVAAYMGAEPLTLNDGMTRLQERRQGMAIREMRTSITFTNTMSHSGRDYRGYGLNTTMKPIQMLNIFASSGGILPIAFNDNIPAFNGLPAITSETQHINDKFGLGRLLVSSLRRGSKLQKTMVEPCPTGRCAPRGDNHPMCACAVRYFVPKDLLPPSRITKADVILARHGLLRGKEN